MGATLSELLVVANARFGSGSPVTWYAGLGLVTSIPNADGSGFTEPTIGVGSYARPALTNNVTNFPAAYIDAGRVLKNNGTAISWGDPTSDWGTAAYVGFFDTITGGQPRWFFEIDGQLPIRGSTTIVQLPAGDLIMPFLTSDA